MKNYPVIVQAKRTPLGAFQGELSNFKASQLGGYAIQSVLSSTKIDEVIMGCVLPAGQGQAPARQAALAAGLPDTTPATTINKVCGSGMKAIMLASSQIRSGEADCIIAGGMESMTNAPYLLDRARNGYRAGHGQVIDHMLRDGLEDAYNIEKDGSHRLMGTFGESTAEKYNLSRADQEKYVLENLENFQKALKNNYFNNEITPITFQPPKGESVTISQDESPKRVKPEKFSVLKTPFKENGTITAATSSSNADGAAALCIMSAEKAEQEGLQPLAQITDYVTFAHQPEWFTTAPIGAIEKLCQKTGWSIKDVDLFEINEAFAVVAMAPIKALSIPREKVNIHGGACILGHPIGASGARIVVTLVHALRQYNLKRGIAAICLGGGEATAVAIECL